MKAKLIRLIQEPVQTLSSFLLFDNDVKLLLHCRCLELPDKQNQNNISRIPAGKYCCKLRHSTKYGWHIHIQDVEGRTLILAHFGNYYRDTRGCLIVGNGFTDIDGDGYRDVTSSKKTMKKILAIAPNEFELTIVDE